jgi:hypothetical protein
LSTAPTRKFRIRLVGMGKPQWEHPLVDFDPAISLARCDGMLAWNAPTQEFVDYRGIRAWYNDEPLNSSVLRNRLGRNALATLTQDEFLHHSNPNPTYRFPCITHYGEPTISDRLGRRETVVAVVSSYGGRIWWRRRGARFRNNFILDSNVELFGNSDSWNKFRRWPWSAPRSPPNYKGPLDGNWNFESQVRALSMYRVNLCLENTSKPYYFTEKFVNAVRGGCVPIYHAHPTVRDSILKGARWIDPADLGFSVTKTISAAFDCDAQAFRENNWRWLGSEQVVATEGYRTWRRIADLLVSRCRCSTGQPGQRTKFYGNEVLKYQ